jgi:iron complex transport system ATP-binding protein
VTTPAIAVERVTVRLGDAEVLREVSLSIRSGVFLTVIGPNGAGKSTLLRCLDGILEPASGRVLINGRPVASLNRRELARTVSFVPQPEAAPLDYTVRAFVEMGRYPHTTTWAAFSASDREAVDEAMELTGVAALAERSLASLSGGERQRASIAAALAQGGEILLLDEPTSFLDFRHQVQILDLLERLHGERGYTIVTVTHDLNSTVASSDLIVALKMGRVVFEGCPTELLDVEALRQIYDVDFRLAEGGHRGQPLVLPARNGA